MINTYYGHHGHMIECFPTILSLTDTWLIWVERSAKLWSCEAHVGCAENNVASVWMIHRVSFSRKIYFSWRKCVFLVSHCLRMLHFTGRLPHQMAGIVLYLLHIFVYGLHVMFYRSQDYPNPTYDTKHILQEEISPFRNVEKYWRNVSFKRNANGKL